MWVLFARAPEPDQPVWPGRRMLALVDAVAWPVALAMGVAHMPVHTGIVEQVLLALCALAVARRTWRAVLVNHRYRFVTTRVLGPIAWLLAIGGALKLAL